VLPQEERISMEKTIIEIIEDKTNPGRLEARISKPIIKIYGSNSAFIKKPGDLKFLEAGLGRNITESILKKFSRNPNFEWISVAVANPEFSGGVTKISPAKFTLSIHKITQKTRERLIEAFSDALGQEKTVHTIKERVIFS